MSSKQGRVSNTALANRNTPFLLSLNLDWLTVSVDEQLPQHMLDYLRLLVEDCSRDVPAVESALEYRGQPLLAAVTPLGEIVLKNDYLRFCLSSEYDRALGLPPAQFTLYSPCFWSAGAPAALSELQKFADELYSFHLLPLRPSRVDVCVDVAGSPMPSVAGYGEWVSRFVRRSKVSRNIANDVQVETSYLGSAKAAVKLRVYNKSLEMDKHGKDYYKAMWSENGYVEGELVTRYEWQLGSRFLREWLADDGVSRITDLVSLMQFLPCVYRYLTHKWVRQVVPSSTDKDRDRWPSSEFWVLMQSARFAFLVVPVEATRSAERKLQLDRLRAQMFGCLKSVLALVPGGSEYDLSEIVQGLYRMMIDYEVDRGESFQSAIARRRMVLAKVA